MSAAILRFLRNPELARQFGQAARACAEELFDIAKNNVVYESLFQELATRPAKERK
jgi:glycosyltransferase involved in cell wall biosynthesis